MKVNENELVESIKTVEFWLNKTSLNNDLIKTKTHTLKALLCTLQIHAEKDKNPAIKEIAKQLEHVIADLREGTLELVNTGRVEQRKAFEKIKEYAEIEE